jgi:ribonuclease HII
VAGVDEVGRGPFAGPVIAAAALFKSYNLPKDFIAKIDDSKKLTAKRRTAIFDEIFLHAYVGFGATSVKEIDRINIHNATLLAMKRSVERLPIMPQHLLVDGIHKPNVAMNCLTVIKGDQKSLSIAAASIVAKVLRDKLMTRLGERYPEFKWQKNAGYGTKEHKLALEAFGNTAHHRMSFKPVFENRLNKNYSKPCRIIHA